MNHDPRKAIRQAMMIARRQVTAPNKAAIGGQKHMLAYITPYEAELLMRRGGSGRITEYGVPAFDDGDGNGGGGDAANSEASTQDAAGGNAGEGAGPTGAGAGATGETGPDDTDASVSGNPAAVSTPTAPTATAPFGTQGFGQAPSAMGMGMIGGLAGAALGAPGLGALGTAIGTGMDVEGLNAQLGMMGLEQNVDYDTALAHNMSLGALGKSATDQFGQTLGFDALAEAPMSAFSAPQGLPGPPADTNGDMPGYYPNPMQQPAMYADGGAVDGDDEYHEIEARHFADGGEVLDEPQKTVKAYKLFRTDPRRPGEIFPLFVEADRPVPMGKWIKASDAYNFVHPGNGRRYVPAKTGDNIPIPNDDVRRELLDRGLIRSMNTKSIKAVAYRPGWHAGDLPFSTHLGERSPGSKKVDRRGPNEVWAEVEMPADVDWQEKANAAASLKKDGSIDPKTAHITDQVPHGGFYRYKTNPNMTGNWMISGGMKVNRILSDDEVKDINDKAGVSDLPRYADGGAVDPFLSNAVPVEGPNGPAYTSQADLDARIQQAALGQGYADGGQVPQMNVGDDPTVQQALNITRGAQPSALQMARQAITQSPKLAATFQAENRPSVIVSPRPGKVGGPPVQREAPEGMPEDFMQEREPWSFATPNIIGTSQPPPIQHPVFNEPRMEKITNATKQIFKNKDFHGLVRDLTGLQGLNITPTVGTWKNEMEPSFILSHPDMTDEHAKTLAHLLGFGFQQDATVQVKHNPETEEGIPAMLAGAGKKLTPDQVDAIHREATKHGMDFTITGDGKAAKFLHFGDEEDLPNFMDKVQSISSAANLPELYTARTAGDLIDAQAYLNGIFRGAGGEEGDQTGAGRSPDLFRRVVNHVLAPYAKAVAGEGYRLSPERLAETYALNDEEREHVRGALYPGKKDDRTTIPLMTGEEQLDVRPTGDRGRASVGDVLYALQNRAAAKGQIDPGDFSDNAKNDIAQNIAKEVAYHVNNSDKSAIGWYDDALKGAMSQYAGRFPELGTDPQKTMLFHAILGITSQGNDVYSNSIHAMRLYDQIQNGGKTLPEAVANLKGSFGDKTRAIETNLLKLNHLLENNGYDRMSDLFNQTKTVGEWNKILREDKSLSGPGGDQLKMQGGSGQKVTGWMVFGPKIGSFINNLHGDYSTLTADLWFSRTWNRLLGHNFIHTPLAEAKQYRDFRDALRAEYYSSNPNVGVGPIPKTEDGKLVYDKKGRPEPWEYGSDAPALGKEEFDDLLNDPDKMLNFAQDITKRYRDSQFKDKSDLRRRAKNWIENRELPVAAPRGDLERQFQQDTVEQAQKLLKKKYGMNISVADIQAALWFHEKELFGKLGVASEKAQPADYADAARRTISMIDSGDLYRVKSKEKGKKAKPQEEFASGGVTPSMRDPVVDRALRMTSRTPILALADLFQRQLRGRQ